MKIVTAEEMLQIDREAEERYGLSTHQLMENAGRKLCQFLLTYCGDGDQALILCGPGNNGGDGLALARYLREEEWDVVVLLSHDPSELKLAPLAQYRQAVESGVPVYAPGERDYKFVLNEVENYPIVVDALLGIGARGAPRGEVLRLVEAIQGCQDTSTIVAVDVPSGIDPDTGSAEGAYVKASFTPTLGLPKPFLFQGIGRESAGYWEVLDIGYPEALTEQYGQARLVSTQEASLLLGRRSLFAHKRSAGVVLVVAGCSQFPGAAVLTALGAYRLGAGLVQVASVPSVLDAVKAHIPECPLFRLPAERTPEGEEFLHPDSIKVLSPLVERADAVALGPGLGRAPMVGEFLQRLFEGMEAKWVLDADALYWIAELSLKPRGIAIYTPHEGEAGRLLKTTPDKVVADRFGSVRELSRRLEGTVLLKGRYTMVCSDGTMVAVIQPGNALLATGGSGDVLTGAISAVLARTGDSEGSAISSAYYHGIASEMLFGEFGTYFGATARDIAEAMARAYNYMEKGGWEEDEEDREDENEEDYEDF